MRDEFPTKIKELLAKRVGFRCSNPECQKPTIGPSKNPRESINIGVASHITAASPGGPRYDPNLSPSERKSPENGIWLCQNCAKLVDSDPKKYLLETLTRWKLNSESLASKFIQEAFLPPKQTILQMSSVFLANKLDQIGTFLLNDIEQQLDQTQIAWREGRAIEAREWLRKAKGNNIIWETIPFQVKAKILSFELIFTLEVTGDINHAKQLADEIQTLAPSDNQTKLRALIAYKEKGPEEAIQLLGEQKDIDILNLKASLLLEMGEVNKCRKELSEIENAGIKPNAETYRIRALLFRVKKDMGKARLEIQKAIELEPKWKSIRFTAAVIDYFSALSPIAIPDSLVSWPVPVEWSAVKCDDTNQKRLEKASEIFLELAEKCSSGSEEQQMYKVWRLACLANDPGRQDEATEYCKTILRTENTNFCVISWVIARDFDVDLKPSEKALYSLIGKETVTPYQILSLVNCYLKSRRIKKAINLLDKKRYIFQKNDAEALWLNWQTQLLIKNKLPERALELIDNSEYANSLRITKTLVLQAIARKTDDWKPVIGHLENSFEETKNSEFLFECCKIKAQLNDWTYVADRAKQLVKEIGTPEVLRLAAIAAYNANRWDLCLQLLNDHCEFFKQKILPGQLRRIKALCMQNLGYLPQAIIEAKKLVDEDPNTENILSLMDIYYSKGDLERLTIMARQLVNQGALSNESLLNIAQKIYLKDPDTAKDLWRKVASQNLPDNLVSWAIHLGFQFGLDKELAPLTLKMQALGLEGKGGIQIKTIKELIPLVKQQYEQRDKLLSSYGKGTIPIHIIADHLNIPLVNLYHRYLEENENTPEMRKGFNLFIRHGGRPLIDNFPQEVPKWRINLDITAVLLAEHLGILSGVEKVFKPLRIPDSLIPALLEMREKCIHPQPKRLEIYKQIIELSQNDLLQIENSELPSNYKDKTLVKELGAQWVDFYEKAKSSKGYVVDFLPLKKKDSRELPSLLPEEVNHHLVNCRAIVEALRQQGPLSENEYLDALQILGTEGGKDISETIPVQGKTLYCLRNIPEVLAEANLLKIVCERFKVFIEKQEYDQIKHELHESEKRRETIDWLNTLIDKLNQGIDNGTYTILPYFPTKDVEPEKRGNTELEQCLLTLLQFGEQEGDVIWTDDRYVNCYLSRGIASIIGINEVLKVLVSAGSLKIADYYKKLSRLRASGVMFIPVEKEEILYCLSQAKFDNGTLIETNALRILRNTIAECLLQGDILQKPPLPETSPNRNGELAFILGLERAISNAIVEIWGIEENDENVYMAQADWLLKNLYIDHLGLQSVTSMTRKIQDDYYFIAINFATLILQAIILIGKYYNEQPSKYQRYFNWIFNRVLKKRFDIEPHLVSMVAEHVKMFLANTQPEENTENNIKRVMPRLIQLLIENIPGIIRDELMCDTQFMNSIGIKPYLKITVHGLGFNHNDFYYAAHQAINGQKAIITPLNINKDITFEPCKKAENRYILSFNHPDTGEQKILDGSDFDLLIDAPIEREAAFRKWKYFFDCDNETFERIIPEIVSPEDYLERIEKARLLKNSSLTIYYENLVDKLLNRETIHLTDFLPSCGEGMLRHFRFSFNVETVLRFQESLEISTKTLLHNIGLQKTIERMVNFPIPLPKYLIEAIAELSGEKSRILIKDLLHTHKSPLSKFHLISILLHCKSNKSVFRRLAKWILKSLFNKKGKEDFESFLSILKWVNDEFSCRQDISSLPSHIRLAIVWAHSNRLFGICSFTGASNSWLQSAFGDRIQRIPIDIFKRDSNYSFDVTHPNQVNHGAFLLSGLSYCTAKIKDEFIDEKLQKLLLEKVFPNKNNNLPNPELLRDFTQTSNSLDSFLGGDCGEKLLILLNEEIGNLFTRPTLISVAENALNKLLNKKDEFDSWAYIYTVLGSLPIYDNFVEQLKIIIRETNFVDLFKKNRDLSCNALYIASFQMINIKDNDALCNLRNQLINITKCFAKQNLGKTYTNIKNNEEFNELRDICLSLLESAINISIAKKQDEVTDFVVLITQLVEEWRLMGLVIKPIIQRFCGELPVHQAKKFWPLLIRLRISNN